MIVCPKCHHAWEATGTSESGGASLNCPACGQMIASGDATIDESNGLATLDLSTVADSPAADSSMATLDAPALTQSDDPFATVLPTPAVGPHGTRVASDSGQATIDLSTVVDNSMATLDATSQSLTGEVATRDGEATLNGDATLELDPLATANFDLSISGGATLDSTDRPGVSARSPSGTAKAPVNQTRRGTLAADSPMTSLGTHTSAKSINHVSVSNRKIASSDLELSANADYRLLHKLGEGAMGVVYAARQCSIDRIVAIKAIKKTNETQLDSREKFLYEAQITGDLDHPNIVPIHELGENDDGTLFYAMKMVSGTPWQKVIRTRSREENVETLMKVADAIAFAHAKRVIHRDLKPENIMLGSFGEVLVMDWGLAVPLDRNMSFGLGGTPAYMAPEMASHNVAKIGPASDTYLLGAILFQIVTGVPPHPGTTGTECLMAAVRNRFVDVSTDDALLRIARKAMESEPSDRYPSVIEFQEAIREYKRHSESIAITGRSRQLARQSQQSQDYEGFSRAIFGFQDALALWSDNSEALHELQMTKLEYARCALAKSDFDLCLGSLDGIQEPLKAAADELRLQAELAKQARLDKERRFVLMRRVLAAVVLVAVTSLSGLSLFLYSARNTILTQNNRLEKQRNDLEVANRSEQVARLAAESAQATAEAAAKSEAEARQLAESSLKAEQLARAEREVALKNEQAAKAEEVKQRLRAQTSAEEAVQARNAEAQAAQAARRSALLARLGEYQTGLNLAMSQTARNDLPHSQQQLGSIARLEKTLDQPAPLLRNWLYRRVNTLNNADLPQAKLLAPPTCASSWPGLTVAAIGDESGNIYLQRTDKNSFGQRSQLAHRETGRVVDLALSPDARLLVSLHRQPSGEMSNLFWKLGGPTPTSQPLRELHHAALQQCEFSPDGQYLVAGNSGGLCVLSVSSSSELTELKRLPIKGQLLSLAWQPGSRSPRAIAMVQQATDERLLVSIDLQQMQTESAFLPADLARHVTCVALTAQGDVLLGDAQGRVHQLTLPTFEKSKAIKTNLTSQSTPTITDASELSGARQSSAIIALLPDGQGNLLAVSDTTAVSTLRWNAEQSQWTSYNQLIGLAGNVRTAIWLDKSQTVLAADENGSLMVWNVAEQTRRQRMTPNYLDAKLSTGSAVVTAAAIDELSQVVTTLDREAALQSWRLPTGELERQADGAYWSYVGHTPGAQLHDWALDRDQKLFATCCRLPAEAANDKLPAPTSLDASPNFEFCVWDLTSGNMRHRWTARLSGGGRIALADSAKKLVVTDADRTLCFDLTGKSSRTKLGEPTVLAFGAALVVTNPQTTHQVMLLRATGAGLVWDVSSTVPSPPEQSKDFNLAVANRFVPLDGLWDRSGRRFYCLLENGQVGRFLWDGRALNFDRLSQPNSALACNQQTQAWQCIDMVQPEADVNKSESGDQITITIRERNRATDVSHNVAWKPTDEQPRLVQQGFRASVLPSGERPTDLCVLSGGELLLIDSAANGFRLTIAPDRISPSVGRTELVAATANRSGSRWIVLGKHDQLWQADRQGDGEIVWQRLRSSLADMQSAGLSPDGRYLMIGHGRNGQRAVSMIDLTNDKIVKRWPGASCFAWHPQRLLSACIQADTSSIECFDLELQQDSSSPLPAGFKTAGLNGATSAQLHFYNEAWSRSDLPTRLWLMMLTEQGTQSRIDFVVGPDQMQAPQWRSQPIQHSLQPLLFDSPLRHLRASPTENTFITGDDGGAVAVWFATPTIAPEARELTTFEAHRSSSITAVQFSVQGQSILSAAINREVFVWPAQP